MKALLQRVSEASVTIEGNIFSRIGKGILIFVGFERGDGEDDLDYLSKKVSSIRFFEDAQGKMNLSVGDVRGEVLVVSQFTLAADCSRGNRPSFDRAEEPLKARGMYTRLIHKLKEKGLRTATGDFGASMRVALVNEGPVTIILDSKG